jgi:hypothetical protein
VQTTLCKDHTRKSHSLKKPHGPLQPPICKLTDDTHPIIEKFHDATKLKGPVLAPHHVFGERVKKKSLMNHAFIIESNS